MERLALVVWFAIGFVELALLGHIYAHGSLHPDLVTGRTYPVQMHGLLYVAPWEGELFYWLLALQFVPIAVLARATERKRRRARDASGNRAEPTPHPVK
jgi:hypothetical protein